MARITRVFMTCDECGTEKDVAEHRVAIDKKAAVVVDACPSCWEGAFAPLATLMGLGRSAKIAARRPRASAANGDQKTAPAKKTTTKRTAKKTTPAKKTTAKRAAKKAAAAVTA